MRFTAAERQQRLQMQLQLQLQQQMQQPLKGLLCAMLYKSAKNKRITIEKTTNKGLICRPKLWIPLVIHTYIYYYNSADMETDDESANGF